MEWRPVAGHPDYQVSRCGLIRGKRGEVMTPSTAAPRGYPHLRYYKVGFRYGVKKRIWRYVHRIVCETFHGAAPPGYTDCCHIDHNPANNHADNLRWGTHEENMREIYTDEAAERRAMKEEEQLADQQVSDAPF